MGFLMFSDGMVVHHMKTLLLTPLENSMASIVPSATVCGQLMLAPKKTTSQLLCNGHKTIVSL